MLPSPLRALAACDWDTTPAQAEPGSQGWRARQRTCEPCCSCWTLELTDWLQSARRGASARAAIVCICGSIVWFCYCLRAGPRAPHLEQIAQAEHLVALRGLEFPAAGYRRESQRFLVRPRRAARRRGRQQDKKRERPRAAPRRHCERRPPDHGMQNPSLSHGNADPSIASPPLDSRPSCILRAVFPGRAAPWRRDITFAFRSVVVSARVSPFWK